jgi:hypothetical protein
MNIDFPAILVGATLFTGLAWAFDSLLLAPTRNRKASVLLDSGIAAESDQVASVLKEPVLIEYCKSSVVPGRAISYPLRFHDAHPRGR